jgi:hypothetical protein
MEERESELRVLEGDEAQIQVGEGEGPGVRWQLASARQGDEDVGSETPRLTHGICVLGMHRSGTSLVAGTLRLLGVDLGPDAEFLPPDSNNQSGYFELADLVEINDEILAHYGGSWDALPELPRNWEQSGELEQLRDRGRRALGRRFAASSQWAWKDPRACITLPFWQRLASGLRYVICLRSPVDIAHSLQAREGEERTLEHYLLDWRRHTASALAYTADRPRTIVQYERFLHDPEREVMKLARFVGREDRLDEPGTMARILDFIDPGLAHSRSASTAIADHTAVPFDAAALYLALQLTADLEATTARPAAPEFWASINALARRCLSRRPQTQ